MIGLAIPYDEAVASGMFTPAVENVGGSAPLPTTGDWPNVRPEPEAEPVQDKKKKG
jgi:hypothetical protein